MRRNSLAVAGVVSTVVASVGPAPTAAQSYAPVGPQAEVSMATVESGGWSRCFSTSYKNWIRHWLPAIDEGCAGERLMLACADEADKLQVLAQAPWDDVFFDAGTGATSSHDANGSQWYFSLGGSDEAGWAWGFAKEGDTLNRTNCDTAVGDFPAQRLCWHLNPDVGGYRCGGTENLNGDTTFSRILYRYTTALFDDGFEAGDTCDWTSSVGDEECSQAIALTLGPPCGEPFVDDGPHDLDPDPDVIGYRYTWTRVQGETGYRVQISLGGTFGSEDDYVELAAGTLETPVLTCERLGDPGCNRVVRVMAHVGHPPGHGATPNEGDLVSNVCALAPSWLE
jgi:hypothetical protein